MSLLGNVFSRKDEKEKVPDKVVDHLSSSDETLAVLDSVTSGLTSYQIRNAEFTSKVLAGLYSPSSRESYEQIVSLDEIEGFPNKQVANEHDAQLLANRVREAFGSDHGLSILAPLDGTTKQTVFVGINIGGSQAGVFHREMNFHEEGVEKKVSQFALVKFLEEYTR